MRQVKVSCRSAECTTHADRSIFYRRNGGSSTLLSRPDSFCKAFAVTPRAAIRGELIPISIHHVPDETKGFFHMARASPGIRAALPLDGAAAPARQPVRTLQTGEESTGQPLTTIPTQPGGGRHGFMACHGLGLVLHKQESSASRHWARSACTE